MKKLFAISAIVAISALGACTPDNNVYVEDYGIEAQAETKKAGDRYSRASVRAKRAERLYNDSLRK